MPAVPVTITMVRNLLPLLLCLLLQACGPIRKPIPIGQVPEQINLEASDELYGKNVLDTLSQRYQLSHNDQQINRIESIVERLSKAAHADKNPWHLYLFQDDNTKNAAATRGNFIFVWSGILLSTQSDAELATILAHEMGHVLAGHTADTPEEESRRLVSTVLGKTAGQVIGMSTSYSIIGDISGALLEAGLNAILINPEQQRKELEADQIGIFLMARAGYDPELAVKFWQRLKTDPDYAGFPIAFLSTHPSSEERYQQLGKLLPYAQDDFAHYQLPGKENENLALQSQEQNQEQKVTETGTNKHLKASSLVFENASTASLLISELKADSLVKVEQIHGRWAQISQPVKGFIRVRDLAQ